MKYSLLNRFRGALLGSFVGEILGRESCQKLTVKKSFLVFPSSGDIQSSQILSDWSRLATCGTKSLIHYGHLNPDDWWLLFGQQQSSVWLKSSPSPSEMAIAMLPIALFFHDDEVKLREQLLQAVDLWQAQSNVSHGALAVAYAIALALTEKLDVATLIPRIVAYLGTSDISVVQQLERVQELLIQGAGLEMAMNELRRVIQTPGEPLKRPDTTIALAFYCFLSTPEDFRLCVSRAIATNQPQTATLTGMLAGVYNSLIGIPVSWRLAAKGMSSGIERLQLADSLLEAWAGVYNISATDRLQRLTVAAPRVIQPR
jgi:ADP-ribosylglycohydrolase